MIKLKKKIIIWRIRNMDEEYIALEGMYRIVDVGKF